MAYNKEREEEEEDKLVIKWLLENLLVQTYIRVEQIEPWVAPNTRKALSRYTSRLCTVKLTDSSLSKAREQSSSCIALKSDPLQSIFIVIG